MRSKPFLGASVQVLRVSNLLLLTPDWQRTYAKVLFVGKSTDKDSVQD